MHAVQAMQRVHGFFVKCAGDVQKCADPARKTKSHEIFRFTASTVDIPTRWNPRAKQQQRVALADFSAAPWQGFEKSERGPNNSSLFQPLAAVVVVAVQVLFRTEKEKPVHIVYWFFLVRIRGLEPPPSCPD